ncbi:MAG: ABC transporter ATP-binding protein [Alphaproteobacteria bacterium]|nr:ABC transporter ATP-binding protein [Alphaproteobacteria bacterium]
MIEIKGLMSGYGDIRILGGVDLHVNAGEIVTVVGGNGAGKTTLIRTIAGMVRPSGGVIRFDGHDVFNRPTHEICELGIAQAPEGRQLFPDMSVEDNLQLGGSLRRARGQMKESLDAVYALFPRLAERRTQLAGTLSGGEQQMAAIGRAMMARPKLLMLDEPSLGLAPVMVDVMFDAISQLHQQGLSILLIEQNVAESLALAQRGYVLENGEVVLEGEAQALSRDERVRQAYLGL